ncbi:MAG: S8 family serine peptidase [Ardenticatenales bacterium]
MSHRNTVAMWTAGAALLTLVGASSVTYGAGPEARPIGAVPPPWSVDASGRPGVVGPMDDRSNAPDASLGAQRSVAPDAALQSDENPGYVPNRLIVGFRPEATDVYKRTINEKYGGQVIDQIGALNIQVLRVTNPDLLTQVRAYQSEAQVSFAEPDYIAHTMGEPDHLAPILTSLAPERDDHARPRSRLDLLFTPNDPYLSQQWHHAKIESAGAWDRQRGAGVTIAIVDTGTNCNHADLAGKCVTGYDYVNHDNNPADDQGHGTHVAGIAAAVTNNGVGGAGVGWDSMVMPVKVLDRTGNGGHSAIASGITYAADHGADIINMSLGGAFTSSALRTAVEYAISHGVVVVAAAGNENTSNPSYPAAYTGVISVAATTQSDQRASFSNYGTTIKVAAPGVSILSTVMTGGYQAWSGTSMASPVVAGLAALLVAQNPSRTPAQVEQILEQSADDLGDRGWDPNFGWGRINARKALEFSPGTSTPGTPGGPTGGTTATPTPPMQPSATPSGNFVLQVEELINLRRAGESLAPLFSNQQLRNAASRQSNDMASGNFCGHNGSDGSTALSRMLDAGYSQPYGEIVACGQVSPAAAVEAWWNSPAHQAIILCTSCTEMGAGYRNIGAYGHFWTVDFGRRAVAGATPTLARTLPPPVTSTPAATSTPPPPTPTLYAPPGGVNVEIAPPNNKAGWVVSNVPNQNFFVDEEDTFTGTYANRTYHGAEQFPLTVIPANATINNARIEMIGRDASFLGVGGTWTVNLLRSDIDANFGNEGYSGIHNAAIDVTLLPLLARDALAEGVTNSFNFDDGALNVLRSRRASSGALSVRMDGPPPGGNVTNLFTWDTGYGPTTRYRGIRLFVNYSPAGTVPATATVTPTELPAANTPTPTIGASPTATVTPVPPTATFTAPPPVPTASPTATVVMPPTQEPTGDQIDILPACQDVGYVRSYEGFNHFCDDDIFVGNYQGRIYFGGVQFDLAAVPEGRAVRAAQLIIDGLSTRYLSTAGNGVWEANLLEAAVDSSWRGVSYDSLRSARISSKLTPQLHQYDLGVGVQNTFALQDVQLRELEFRKAATGKISFRLDGPQIGVSNVMDWDTGFGAGSRTPPVLRVTLGPPGSGEPAPTKTTDDLAKINEVVAEINRVRVANGRTVVAVSSELQAAAATHNTDMIRNSFFSHTGSDGSTPAQRVARTGFSATAVGELLAAANGTPSVVVQAWMDQGQRDTVLDPSYGHIGAHYQFVRAVGYQHYWTVILAHQAP